MTSILGISQGFGYLEDYSLQNELGTFQMQVLSACAKRRFAVTERGYMALVPHCARIGDRIALILGAPVPFVLRATGNYVGWCLQETMQLVGDAYVHGIMDGEGMEFEEFAPQMIWLC